MYLQINKKKFNLTKSPLIVGILNLTPDSFYDGNKYKSRYSILKRVEQIIIPLGDGMSVCRKI